MRSIDRVRDAYGNAVARIVRLSIIGLVMVAVAGAGTAALLKATPTGFLPEDDQGAFFVVIQLPGGASVARTLDVVQQAEAMVKQEDAVSDYTSVVGVNYIDNYSHSNAAFMVVTRKPFEERPGAANSDNGIFSRLAPKLRQIGTATVLPLAPPPIVGLGTGGGFTYVLEDLRGGDPAALAQVVRGLTVAANQDPQLSRVFSTFSATNPSVYLDIDRDKGPDLSRRVAEQCLSSVAGLARQLLCQQHQSLRADLAGPGASRGAGSRQHRRHLPHQRAQRRRPDDPAAEPTANARRCGLSGRRR